MTSIKRRLAAGGTSIGGWLTTSSDEVAEIMASTGGYDWLAVDMEHGSAGIKEALAAFRAAKPHGVDGLARLPSADPYLARRLLDGGAAGILVPVVESAEAFAAFAAHCLYPPRGRRCDRRFA